MSATLFLRFGPRFPCMSDAYDRTYCGLALDSALELGYQDFVREGVYCMLTGPNYETVSESRMLKTLGADAVGRFTHHPHKTTQCINIGL